MFDAWNATSQTTWSSEIATTISIGTAGIHTTVEQVIRQTNTVDVECEMDSGDPVIVKAGIMTFVTLMGFVGNGIALATIKRAPKLRTKTYALLFSLTVSDLMTGVTMLWVIPYQLAAYVFNKNPCSFILPIAILAFPQRVPLIVTVTHVGLISVERYIAVVHPLQYEKWVSETTIKRMIAFGWIFPVVPTSTFLMYVSRINWQTCTIAASVLQATVMDICYLMTVIIVIFILYTCILIAALRQRAKISSEVS
jgi:hypothetical protein